MRHLETVLTTKDLEDLQYTEPNSSATRGSNIIEPSVVMINQIINMLLWKRPYKRIKRMVQNSEGKSVSYSQIREIDTALKARIVELSNADLHNIGSPNIGRPNTERSRVE